MRQCLGFSVVFIERWCCCRYQPSSIQTPVRAILSTSGFLDSTDAGGTGPLGIVLERTPFYAGMLLSSAVNAALRCAAWWPQQRSWQRLWIRDSHTDSAFACYAQHLDGCYWWLKGGTVFQVD